jgi:hypothetical protein
LALVLLYEAISADFELETVHERWRRRKECYGEKLPSIESVVAAEIENRVAVGAAFLAQRETIESFASDPCAETKGHVESLLNIIRDGFLVAKQMQHK